MASKAARGHAELEKEIRARMCERKKWFRTRYAAELAIPNMASYAYHCRFCDGWHLATSKT